MKYVLVIALPLLLLFSACETEEVLTHGTVLKELVTKGSDGEVFSHYLYTYDNAGNIISIYEKKWGFFHYNIQYHNNKISWINNDSLVYEDGKLIKSIYVDVDEDTSYTHFEFEVEGGLLYKKSIYLWDNGGGIIKPALKDTLEIFFEYDDRGNAIKTTLISEVPLLTDGLSNLLPNGEFSFDENDSPYADFPKELKFFLSINPGPNNVTSQELVTFRSGIPYTVQISYEYNLDNLPLKSISSAPEKLTAYYKYY